MRSARTSLAIPRLGPALAEALHNMHLANDNPAPNAVGFTINMPDPYRPAVLPVTWQGQVFMNMLEEVGCGGTSILQAMAWGYLPRTNLFSGPVVA